MKIKGIALLGIAVLVCLGACKPKDEKGDLTLKKGVLMVGMEIGYPPMEYFAEDGKTPIGFDVEMAKALADKMGLKVEYVDTAWDGIFAGVETDKYDCIMSSVTFTEERAAKYNFTRPYAVNSQLLIVRKDAASKPKNLEEVQGLRLTFQGETTSDELFQAWEKDTGLKIDEVYRFDKVMNCFDELSLNRADVILVDSVVAADYLSKPNNPYEISAEVSNDEVLAICLKKGNDGLTNALNNALNECFSDGTLSKISMKIFGSNVVSSLWK